MVLIINSICKGKGFEREVAKILSNNTGVLWNRVPQSGAFCTVNKSEDTRFMGDVFSEAEAYKNIVIECKACAEFNISELFNPNSKFYSWLKQTEAESNGLAWCLFFKPNNKGIYAVASKDTLHKLGVYNEPFIEINGLLTFIKV